QVGARVEDAAEDQHRDDDRVLDDDAEAVEEPVAGRALHHEVVLRLRMEEEHGPMASAALNNGRNLGASQFSPLTTVPSSAPFRPRTVTARSSSSIAALTSCTGSVARPANRWGHCRAIAAISSFTSRASACPCAGSSW